MQHALRTIACAIALSTGAPSFALANEAEPGSSVESLLALAKERNPEYASMRHEAQAAGERVAPAHCPTRSCASNSKTSPKWENRGQRCCQTGSAAHATP
jgi:hypothetical protein